MNVLHATTYFYPSIGGTQRYVQDLCETLTKQGQHTDVLTMNTNNVQRDEYFRGIHIMRMHVDMRLYRAVFSVEFAKTLFSLDGYDLYHIHTPFHYGSEMVFLASRLFSIPVVVTHHGARYSGGPLYTSIYSAYYRLLNDIELPMAKKIIFLSRSLPDSLRLSKAVREKIIIVPPAVDTTRFSPTLDGSNVRRLYGISESDTVLLFVGDLEPTLKLKGIDYLLDALKSIVKLFPSLKLLVVGGGSRLPELRAIVNSLGLDRCVTFCGQVSGEAMPKYYAACDLFVFPSYGDSLGLVVLEAMAVGKPVIVSNIPGINEIVKSGETGLLIPPKDPSSLAHAITYLLKNNDLMTKMGKNARTSAIQRSWDMVALEMSKIYENVVRGRSC